MPLGFLGPMLRAVGFGYEADGDFDYVNGIHTKPQVALFCFMATSAFQFDPFAKMHLEFPQ